MTAKQRQRLWYLGTIVLGCIGLGIIIASAFQQNLMYFLTPSELLKDDYISKKIRLGGLVEKGSIRKEAKTLTTLFNITDKKASIPVTYVGIVPDLFREDQGVIVEGMLSKNGVFQGTELLAKHDENYMPPEIAQKLGN